MLVSRDTTPVITVGSEQEVANLLDIFSIQYAGEIAPRPDPVLGHTFEWPAQVKQIFQTPGQEIAA